MFIRELLLGGALAERGFVDKEKVDEFLSALPSGECQGEAEIFSLVQTEMWLRSLSTRKPLLDIQDS